MNKRYNAFHRKHITLEEGERFCTKCDGKGKVPRNNTILGQTVILLVCNECLGDGKIDWVEEVVGKKRMVMYGYSADAEL